MSSSEVSPGRLVEALEHFKIAPRAWQTAALSEWVKEQRGTVAVATGGGKTYFAYLAMKEFAQREPLGRVLIIVPTLALLDQWLVGLVVDAGVRRDSIAVLNSTSTESRTKLFNLCVINSARRATARVTSGGIWLACVDECHRAGSPENAKALRGRFSATLGLSATPERQYDEGFEAHVAPALGGVIFRYGVTEALQDGVIAPFELFNYRIPLEPEEAEQYDRYTRRLAVAMSSRTRGEANDEVVKRILQQRASVSTNAKWRVPAAAALISAEAVPTLVFHERISAAEEIARLANRFGRRAVVYHSRLSAGMRQRNLEMFRQGIASVLIACRSLDEGLNVPEAELGILAASTRSTRQRIQRLGRVLRKSKGKERARVMTLYATDVEEKSLAEEAERLEGITDVSWLRADLKQ